MKTSVPLCRLPFARIAKNEAEQIHQFAENIRNIIDELERRDHPNARHPLVQEAKILANMADGLLVNKKEGTL
jgi:hypothetical protein